MNLNLHKSNPALLLLLALFTCSLLLNFGSFAWKYSYTCALITAAVGLQFLNYRFWWATMLAIIFSLIVIVPGFPRLANHTNIELGAFLIIIIVVVRKILFNKGIKYETITQIFRWTLITLYFWAGFHKLNSGFFTIEGSCTVAITQNLEFIFGDFFTSNKILVRLGQIGTVAVEMILPFGLLFKKTRRVAALLLVLFHAYLSLCNFSNFSAFAGFLIAGSVIDLSAARVNKDLITGLRVYQFFAILSVIVSYGLSRSHIIDHGRIMFVNGVIFNIGWLLFFYKFLRIKQSGKPSEKIAPATIIISLLISLWAIQGYLGLSNAGTLTMFSNLVTEKSRSNHYLINTAKTKIWDFEEDYVTIISPPKGIRWGKKYRNEDFDLPMVQFKYLCDNWSARHKEKLSCTIMYRGRIIVIPDLKASEYSKPEWWYKYLLYRRIPKDGVYRCLW